MLKTFLLTVVLTALLGACTPAAKVLISSGAAKLKDANDTAAILALAAPCAMTVGAYNRLPHAAQRGAVDILCGGVR